MLKFYGKEIVFLQENTTINKNAKQNPEQKLTRNLNGAFANLQNFFQTICSGLVK